MGHMEIAFWISIGVLIGIWLMVGVYFGFKCIRKHRETRFLKNWYFSNVESYHRSQQPGTKNSAVYIVTDPDPKEQS